MDGIVLEAELVADLVEQFLGGAGSKELHGEEGRLILREVGGSKGSEPGLPSIILIRRQQRRKGSSVKSGAQGQA